MFIQTILNFIGYFFADAAEAVPEEVPQQPPEPEAALCSRQVESPALLDRRVHP